jgi:hypothetical protein
MMTTHFENCQEVISYICGHFGEDENSERCREMKKHLESCPDCSTYCDSMDKMIGLYRAASPCFPEHARNSLLASLGIDETK